MKSPSLAWRVLSAACLLPCLSACQPGFVKPTPPAPLRVKPAECLKVCPPMPDLTGPSEAELWRWQESMVGWGEACAAIPDACVKEMMK